MRYIQKNQEEPDYLSSFKKAQRAAKMVPRYDDFRDKKSLNDDLRKEQHQICCYCEREIRCFQGKDNQGSHNEHLVPQCLDKGDGAIDLDYGNIYACCNTTRCMPEKLQHCGAFKGHAKIDNFIQMRDCEKYFQYNQYGEILPQGPYIIWSDYVNNEARLQGMVKKAFNTIKALHLNVNSLVNQRKGQIRNFMEMDHSPQKIQEYLEKKAYPMFLSMLSYCSQHEKFFAFLDDVE